WDTALHTMVSFLTNTNPQPDSGQAQLSYFSQMTAITGLQEVTPMMGLALVVATLRALFGTAPVGDAAEPALPADRRIDVGTSDADVV
ncbi:potassium-transporting ATPase subunit KdpA, partial [Stenotrophomonas sp. SrG]|uniref:potassium-transporting ATPase subunit KdpA n=1 Tax=Stenotrophomonas sp. SrG TaxID=3414430 RepID=UPI003CF502A5